MQAALLDNLCDCAANVVHIDCGGRLHTSQQPVDQLGRVIEPNAVREDAAQARTGAIAHLLEQPGGRSIAVATEGEVNRQLAPRNSVDFDVAQRRVIQNHEPGEMQTLERAERHQLIGRISQARRRVHRLQNLLQLRQGLTRDRRENRELILWRHGLGLNCRQKSMSRSLAQ